MDRQDLGQRTQEPESAGLNCIVNFLRGRFHPHFFSHLRGGEREPTI